MKSKFTILLSLISLFALSQTTKVKLNQMEPAAGAGRTIITNTAGVQTYTVSNVTGMLNQGTNVVLTGSGTIASPYTITASGGSGSPAGSNSQIQFNNAGAFGASSNLTFTNSTLALTGSLSVAGTATAASFIKSGGTSSQFLKADGSSDGNTYLQNITGKLVAGANTTLTGAGTAASPYTIAAASGGGGGTVSIPNDEIVFGNGSGITSTPKFYRNSTVGVGEGQTIFGNSLTTSILNYRTDAESFVVIARSTDPSLSTNAHGFVDATEFNRSTSGTAYCSYGANVDYIGAANYDHNVPFQSVFILGDGVGGCDMTTYYGGFDYVTVNSGSNLVKRYGPYMQDGVGSGTIQYQCPLYVPTLSKGTENWAIDIVSNDIRTGGNANFVTASSSSGAKTGELRGYFAGTVLTNKIYSKLNNNSTQWSFLVSQSALNAAHEILILDGDNGSGTGVGSSILTPAKVRIGSGSVYPSANLDVTGTASVSGNFTAANVYSGSYTPTLTGITNISASTAYVTGYYRIGNAVTVFGKVDIDAAIAASADTELQLTLPVSSNFTGEEDLGGDASSDALASLVARIKADSTTDKASIVFKALSLTNDSYSFTFSYQVK